MLLGLSAVAAPMIGAATVPASAASTTRFTAAADAAVSKASPSTRFGASTVIRTDGTPVVRSYLRFNVAGLTGPVTKATLRVFAKDSGAAFKANATAAGWAEGTLTWNNAPAVGTAAGSSATVTAGTWASVDVTGLVAAGGGVNMVLTSTNAKQIRFNSREATRKRPQLVVETASDTTTTTAPPTTTTTAPLLSGDRCVPAMTARQARYNLLGYLFSDGHFQGSTFNYRTGSDCTAARVTAALKLVGVHAVISKSSTGTHFAIDPVAPFDHYWSTGVPDDTAVGVASDDDLRWFLAATLEGEGSGGGKVLDDPNWGRTSGVVGLYSRLGVVVKPDHAPPTCGCSSDPSFWNTYVDPTADKTTYNGYVATIRSWPMASMSRVPQFR
jgi:hypothetical protein